MKVPQSVRRIYDKQVGPCERLIELLDDLFHQSKPKQWFYTSRIKGLESFAQKLETGRCPNPWSIEDLVGCTLVVENSTAIGDAVALVEKHCTVQERRPKSSSFTHKRPESFPFDDLRLYVKLTRDDALPVSDLYDILFEVQIKTFLEHAWGIATHDLIYKSDATSWARARVAYQIKAMLEHAELSIQQIKTVAAAKSLDKSDYATRNTQEMIDLIKAVWRDKPDALPKDVRRLAETFYQLKYTLGISKTVIETSLQRETADGRGVETLNLSPYGILIQSLLNQGCDELDNYLLGNDGSFRIFLPEEVELPPRIDRETINNAISLPPEASQGDLRREDADR